MNIEPKKIKVRDIYDGYKDSEEYGVVAYGGKLNVRPAFQREFVYKEKERNEVIKTISNDYPLNIMYWSKNETGYELLDGQQRTISICQYINGDFSIDYKYFHTLTKEEQEKILNYDLMVYVCEGTDKEKLEWFKIINIAGVELTQQELRNAIYTGTWLTEAKKYFSKTRCPAYQIGNKYLKGSCIRQDYLETILSWISSRDGIDLEQYMANHQHDPNASELWLYFNNICIMVVILWV